MFQTGLSLTILLALPLGASAETAQSLEDAVAVVEQASSSSCDLRNSPIRLEIARALMENFGNLSRLTRTSGYETVKTVKVGPAIFQLSQPGEIELATGYIETTKSWDTLYARFREIKNKPADPRWAQLASSARYLTELDVRRLVDRLPNYYQEAAADYLTTISAIEACLAQESCSTLPATINQSPVLTQAEPGVDVPQVTEALALAPPAHRAYLQNLLQRLRDSYDDRFAFAINDSIARTSRDTIEVPLDAGSFKGFEAEIAPHFEQPWSSKRLRVKIRWTSRAQEPRAFLLFYDDRPGAVSSVSYKRREMRLGIKTPTSTLAHEFGHVLGFKDRYFHAWSAKDCAYLEQFRYQDIMSFSSMYHPARDEDFVELDRRYPFEKP